MTRRAILIASTLLLSILLSGCVDLGTTGTPAGSGSVPYPSVGSRYVYETYEGARLTVAVEGRAERVDGLGRTHQVILLNLTLEQGEDEPFSFEEAIDLAEGRVIQQVAYCGITKQRDGGPKSCFDERSMVDLASLGYPGALGMGPLWGLSIEGLANRTLDVENPLLRGGTLHVSTAPAKEPNCHLVSFAWAPAQDHPGLPWTVLEGPATVCAGEAFPHTFKARTGRVFTLVEAEIGPGDPVSPAESAWTSTEGPVTPAVRNGRIPVHGPSNPFPFTTREAHSVALNRSESYGDLFESSPGAAVVETWGRVDGSGCLHGRIEEWSYQRVLSAVREDGVGVHLIVEERTYEDQPTSHEIVDEQRISISNYTYDVGSGERLPRMRPMIRFAQTLTGAPIDWHLGTSITTDAYTSGWDESFMTPREKGWTVVVWTRDTNREDASGGTMVHVPYTVSFDGSTGGLLWAQLPREALPLDSLPADQQGTAVEPPAQPSCDPELPLP